MNGHLPHSWEQHWSSIGTALEGEELVEGVGGWWSKMPKRGEHPICAGLAHELILLFNETV